MAKTIKELFEKGILTLATIPINNDYLLTNEARAKRNAGHHIEGSKQNLDLTKLDKLDGIVLTIIKKDYKAVSPNIWNTVYTENNLNYRRIFAIAPITEQAMHEFLQAVKYDPKCLGGGAGSGFKDKIVPVLQQYGKLHPLAEIIGAANVIHKEKDGTLIGMNSDGEGFVEGLLYELGKYNEKIEGKKITILGAGGTCAAIAFSLMPYKPKEIVIVNRTVQKAQEIADRINAHYHTKVVYAVGEDELSEELPDTHAVVNTSDKGGEGPLAPYSAFGKVTTDAQNHPIPAHFTADTRAALHNMELLPRTSIIADVNLPEHVPTTLQYARAAGYTRLQDGLEMVARQAALQFKQRHGDLLPYDKVRTTMFRAAGLTHE
ncbi:MAG TPA: hypothetical protein VLJ21_04295 [Candidatus Binatia bacterium]|nr:hypothetical protein [Candidatus Binatia bacterium]